MNFFQNRIGLRHAVALGAGLVASLLLTDSLSAATQRADADQVAAARQVVAGVMDQVLAALSDGKLSEDQRLHQIEAVAYANFDFETMAKLVLARNWKTFSKEERVRFVAEFKNLLARTYGSRLQRYSDEGVEVVGARGELRGDVTVQTRIVGGNFDGATVDYRMRERKAVWKAIDAVVEGVSLVSAYRTQFREVLSGGSPAELLERMSEKNSFSNVGR
ncbi:MAG: ABC transporter substrate-binding protein [Myxococcota bacterium]|nr:ABC transporter substrate-binding protein [Myxococcota bacterium]